MSGRALRVYRYDIGKHEPVFIGSIDRARRTFAYSRSSLSPQGRGCAISQAMPLRPEPYGAQDDVAPHQKAAGPDSASGARSVPFFDGLAPEGPSRMALANALGVYPENTLEILRACGGDCAGSIILADEDAKLEGRFMALKRDELESALASDESVAEGNARSRSLLPGSRSKLMLAHLPGAPPHEGWLWPLGAAGSTHILKIAPRDEMAYLEFLCMAAARACELVTPRTTLIEAGRKPVLVSERFDRFAQVTAHRLVVDRYHQEDIAQALGIAATSKYRGLGGDTVHIVAEFLRARSASPLNDIRSFATALLLDYLLGNCDNHLKNFAVLYAKDMRSIHLAPVYDIVPTTLFERLPRTLGIPLGDASVIDEVAPRDLYHLAYALGVTVRVLQHIARIILERAERAVGSAAAQMAEAFPEIEYMADELLDDAFGRRQIMEAFANMRSM